VEYFVYLIRTIEIRDSLQDHAGFSDSSSQFKMHL